jgi:tRNA nucleotidyltransferase (CCA-adding enzyme)
MYQLPRGKNDFAAAVLRNVPELTAAVNFDQHNPHHDRDIFQHSIDGAYYVYQNYRFESYSDTDLIMVMLLHDIGKLTTLSMTPDGIGRFSGHAKAGVEPAREILNRLRGYDQKEKDRMLKLIEHHDFYDAPTTKSVSRLYEKLGYDRHLFGDYLVIRLADINAQSPYRQKEKMDAVIGMVPIFRRSILKISA